ncbi:MAG TPA: pitrilysin family protein [Candidatus Dormibacteraeota bacterium]
MAPRTAPAGPRLRRLRLQNGLDVVLTSERSSPTVAVGMYYRAGFRLEEEGRTGFAHLFEHLMFQGTARVTKADFGRLITGAGGILNGSTRHDYTNYFEVLPASALEMACFLEADRMENLDINQETLQNQIDVVKEEVRVNVLNRPYGGFSWLWLSQYAFATYPNAHNFYGEFADLEGASVADARAFYETWYGPGNATLVLVGDFEEEAAVEIVERHFGPVAARPAPPLAEMDEPIPQVRTEHERRDALAPNPRVAVGYRTAPFGHPDHLPLVLAARVLTDGRSSRLQRRLIREREVVLQVDGGPHFPIGDAFEFRGPALFTFEATPRPGVSTAATVTAIDEELAEMAEAGPTPDELLRAQRRELSSYHASTDSRLGRLRELGVLASVHDQPELADRLPKLYEAVTAAEVQAAVRGWLRPEHSTVLHWLPEGVGGGA